MNAIIGKDVEKAAQWLQKGEVVAIPTETVYGLAGLALHEQAVARIFEVKNRPHFNPLIVHLHSPEQLHLYVKEVPLLAQKLAEQFWPGPLTLLLDKKALISDLVTAGNDRVAIRIPAHPLTLELLKYLDAPLAAPSANPFGYISPTDANHVYSQLGTKIPYILDGGPAKVGLESTIIGFDDFQAVLYRPGGIPREEIEEICGPLAVPIKKEKQPQSSGRLKSHYAPQKALFVGEIQELWNKMGGEKTAVLVFDQLQEGIPVENQFLLSPSGDDKEAARRLFAILRELDQSQYERILTCKVPEKGLGRAINDRLHKAQAIYK